MKYLIVAPLFLFSLVALAELPEESATLIQKLNEWELEKQAELQTELQKKRQEVVAILQRQLEATTKAGDLDGALAIKKEIKRLSPVKSEPVVTTPEPEIPKDAHRGRKSFYLWIDQQTTWKQAQEECRRLGGNLVSISDEREWEEVLEYRSDVAKGKRFWIGLAREGGADTPMKWVDHTPLEFSAWADGQPSPRKNGPLGAQVSSGAGWFGYLVEETGDTHGFICEWPRN